MISSIEYIYKKGSNVNNEDAYVIDKNRNIFAAIDGATGLGGLAGNVASTIVKEGIENSQEKSLKKIIASANQSLAQETKRITGMDVQDIPKYERSTCGLAAIQLDKSTLHYLSAGDCMIFIQYKTGAIRTLTYDHLDVLDAMSITTLHLLLNQRAIELETSLNTLPQDKLVELFSECRAEITPLLRENRNKLNTTSGYGIIDGSSEALSYLESGSIPLINVEKILLLSDGLKLHQKDCGWHKSAELAFEKGVSELFQTIQEVEDKDPACFLYPRLKKHDDKTGILIQLL
ncbi:hypothetical protein SM124_09100 [Bacillus sp. 31A1R]|uniref:PPM-type phosphatase domain-containing protein n=1 Tax=Robertmurraya mangrovi TaxID=3098077 RepID=A0ABU5IXK9_9BACI|nr:hypothetical protein [Bacillus sp. 31A1R]MDZ5471903.1 hypothetical protein [Bacillus sp. 31A1R]